MAAKRLWVGHGLHAEEGGCAAVMRRAGRMNACNDDDVMTKQNDIGNFTTMDYGNGRGMDVSMDGTLFGLASLIGSTRRVIDLYGTLDRFFTFLERTAKTILGHIYQCYSRLHC